MRCCGSYHDQENSWEVSCCHFAKDLTFQMYLYNYSISWVGCIEISKLPIDDRIYWDSIPVLQHVQDAREEIDIILL